MNQVVLGAAVPLLIAGIVYLSRRCRASLEFLLLTPLFMALGGIWAVVPDLPRVFGNHALYDRLAKNPACDVFLFHYTIDQKEIDSPWWLLGLLAIGGSLLFAAIRELWLAERRRRPGGHDDGGTG